MRKIAKTPYGHFVGLKAITYCNTADEQRRIVAGLSGHFVAVGTNVIGARTAEALINVFPAKTSRPLKAEFYGNVRNSMVQIWPCAHMCIFCFRNLSRSFLKHLKVSKRSSKAYMRSALL
jgi:hypothetical protein